MKKLPSYEGDPLDLLGKRVSIPYTNMRTCETRNHRGTIYKILYVLRRSGNPHSTPTVRVKLDWVIHDDSPLGTSQIDAQYHELTFI